MKDKKVSFILQGDSTTFMRFLAYIRQRVVYTESVISHANNQYQTSGVCQDDASRRQTIIGTSQIITVSLSNLAETENPIVISLLEIPVPPNDVNTNETLAVTLGPWLSTTSEEGDALMALRFDGINANTIFLDSITLNNRVFFDVYESFELENNPKFDVMYNESEGLLFLRNTENGRELVYDRKE